MTNIGHRQFILIQGEASACKEQALRLLGSEKAIWISAQDISGQEIFSMQQVSQLLGQEYAGLVFDAHGGFNGDAFGAACGLVVGGGAFIMLTPPLLEWADRPDPEVGRLAAHGFESGSQNNRFIRHLLNVVRSGAVPQVVDADKELAGSLQLMPYDVPESSEQKNVIAAVLKVATGHRRRPLALTADRGRGKTAAFGIAAAQLLMQGKTKILVTAPRMDATIHLFKHATQLLPDAKHSRGLIESGEQRILFVAPDDLIQNPQTADLLLVDEAAGIPTHLLEAMLKRYSRIAFATTLHGYEGTGRGFSVRFSKVLNQITPQWKALELRQPMRWSERDPLETFCFKALLMDAEPAADEELINVIPEQLQLEKLDRDLLLTDSTLLNELFGLLVTAHYRTTPADLRQLLDGSNISVWVARHDGHVVATILTAKEGGFSPELAQDVWLGKRRPHGHLLAEMLEAQIGLKRAACLKYVRVIRIAVHPALQGKGIGTAMMAQLEGVINDTDILGVSFAATAQLICYWQHTGFVTVRVGLTRDASSGAHSVLMLRGMSAAGKTLESEVSSKFHPQFPVQLSEPLTDLEPDIVMALLAKREPEPIMTFDELKTFAHGTRNYGDCLLQLRQLTLHLAASGFSELSSELTLDDAHLLVSKVLQGRSWHYTARLYGLSGRKQVTQKLRQIIRTCLA